MRLIAYAIDLVFVATAVVPASTTARPDPLKKLSDLK